MNHLFSTRRANGKPIPVHAAQDGRCRLRAIAHLKAGKSHRI
jgi:hypothetical protein